MPTNHAPMKLGKKAPRIDNRTLMLANYVDLEKLAPPPKSDNNSGAVKGDFGMLLNDSLGDCTIAAALHMEQVWSANVSRPVEVTDAEALEAYERICGYDQDDPNSDQGGVELDVLNAWRKQGIGGREIVAFVALDPKREEYIKAAIHLFGGIYTGLSLPISAQNQDVWTPARGHNGAPGSWGGHAVPFVDYNGPSRTGGGSRFTCVTWGDLKQATWHFLTKYCDEAYAVVSKDWLDAQGKSPDGFDMAALLKDLKSVTGHKGAASTMKAGVRKPVATGRAGDTPASTENAKGKNGKK